jgi:hypothetical protein
MTRINTLTNTIASHRTAFTYYFYNGDILQRKITTFLSPTLTVNAGMCLSVTSVDVKAIKRNDRSFLLRSN